MSSPPTPRLQPSLSAGPARLAPTLTEDARAELRRRLRSYLDLPDDLGPPDLAGNPVVKPSSAAVSEALRFLAALPAGAPSPSVGWADDGEVGFLWRRDCVFIDVGFCGDGNISYYARVAMAGIDHDGDEGFADGALPQPLVSAIAALSP